MCDEFTRENLARRVGRSVLADDVVGRWRRLGSGAARQNASAAATGLS